MTFTQELALYNAVSACRRDIAEGFRAALAAADAAMSYGCDPAEVERLASQAERECAEHRAARHAIGRPRKESQAAAAQQDEERVGMTFAEYLAGGHITTDAEAFPSIPPIEKLGVPPATSQGDRRGAAGGGGG